LILKEATCAEVNKEVGTRRKDLLYSSLSKGNQSIVKAGIMFSGFVKYAAYSGIISEQV
jgi:hypothetical protein